MSGALNQHESHYEVDVESSHPCVKDKSSFNRKSPGTCLTACAWTKSCLKQGLPAFQDFESVHSWATLSHSTAWAMGQAKERCLLHTLGNCDR